MDGVWTAAEPTARAAEGGRAAALKQRHEESKRPVETERQLAYLVQLLSDSAYWALPVHQRVHQLEALLLKELVVSAGGDLPARAGWEPFTNASSVYNQGRIDNGKWALPDCTPHPGVAVTEGASCTAIPAEAGSGQPQMFRLLRCHHGAAPRRLHASMRQSSVATAAALSRVPCSTGDFNLGKSQPLRYESEALDLFNNVFNGPQNTQVPKMTSKKSKFV